MSDITANLIVLLVLLVIGGGIFVIFQRRKTEADKLLDQAAREHGWKLVRIKEPLEWGVRITHPDWQLEAISRSSGQEPGPGSSNVSMHTLWQAERPGSTVMLGPRAPGAGLEERFIRPIVQAFSGEDLVDVNIQHPELQARYMLRAVEAASGEALLNPFLVSKLLGWKKTPPLIRRDSTGITMEIKGERLKTPEDLLAFIRIGEALLVPQ